LERERLHRNHCKLCSALVERQDPEELNTHKNNYEELNTQSRRTKHTRNYEELNTPVTVKYSLASFHPSKLFNIIL